MERIPGDAYHLLEGKNFAHVATLMPDGSPQVTPVWIGHQGDIVTFNTAEGRLKPNNLRRDPRVGISVTNSENQYEALLIQGHVTEVTQEGADDDINALAKRYIGADEYPFRGPGEVRVIVRIEPDKVSYTPPAG